ncbi:hypothetical protein ACIQ7S_21270 [Streptomyces griseoluteus]|uniref:hypothetical protein n=1 Tax=Streptomyces griseoluteus TaxID=29306 RepID=UPI00331D2F88
MAPETTRGRAHEIPLGNDRAQVLRQLRSTSRHVRRQNLLPHADAFLTGYEQHALRHDGHGLTGWHDWLIARRGRDCNHAWTGQVLHIALPNGWDDIWNLPPEDEQHAIKALLELLDGFAAEREAAQGTHDSLRGIALEEENPDDVERDAGLAFRP